MFSRFSRLPMVASGLFALTALAADNSTIDNTNSTCLSYGIDFVDGGSYFINTNSNTNFTCVSQFEGCNSDVADIILQDPNGNDYSCGTVPTTPDDVSEMATCAIEKSQMFSGEWIIFILGNNLDGNPFAYNRMINLTCGPQQTVTSTSTVVFTSTVTPNVTVTSTTLTTVTSTLPASTTITQPAATASNAVTVFPKPTTISTVQTLTRTRVVLTKTLGVTTVTETPSCTIPGRPAHGDPTCTLSQTLVPWPTGISIGFKRESDMLIGRKRRLFGLLPRMNEALVYERDLVGRSADVPTVTVAAPTPVNSTTTVTGPATTFIVPTTVTSTVSITAPPATVHAGTFTSTVSAHQPTRTKVSYTAITTTSTKTISLIWTYTTSVTPTASVSACKHEGGHFGWHHGW